MPGTISRTLYDIECVQGSINGTNGIPISFKVLPMVPLREPRTEPLWAKLPTLESRIIKYGVMNFNFINFTNKHFFIRMIFANNRNTESESE